MNEIDCADIRIYPSQKGGVSIAFVFFIIVIFSTLGVVGFSIMTVDNRMAVKNVQAYQARYFAEAGAEYGIRKVFDGQTAPYSETVSVSNGSFTLTLTDQDSVIELASTGNFSDARKTIQVKIKYRPPIGDFAIYAIGEVDNVTALDEAGDIDPSLLVDNAPFLPDIDDSTLIAMATSQGHVYSVSEFAPAHGYPNFNFYYSGTIPNVTYVQGDFRVLGGRTVYGIFAVDGDIRLEGSSRVEGVLYLINPNSIVIHGGGSSTQSSVTGGIIANGDIDGTGNHITVHYNSEYMQKFGEHENTENAREIVSWREF